LPTSAGSSAGSCRASDFTGALKRRSRLISSAGINWLARFHAFSPPAGRAFYVNIQCLYLDYLLNSANDYDLKFFGKWIE
jgi:hypothetical protein